MSFLGDAFVSGMGKPDIAMPNGLNFKNLYTKQLWEQVHNEIGSGWFLNRFVYLFGEGLHKLQPCLDAWSFLVKPDRERISG